MILIVVPAVTFLVILPLAAYYSWALITMWEWFITPTFDIPAPPLVVAMALFLMIGLFKEVKVEPETKKKDAFKNLGTALLKPIFLVALGDFLKGYM